MPCWIITLALSGWIVPCPPTDQPAPPQAVVRQKGVAFDRTATARPPHNRSSALVVTDARNDSDVAPDVVKNKDVPAAPTGQADRAQSRLLLTVFEVEGDAAQVAALSADALTSHAESIASLSKALSRAGTTRILYNFDQAIEIGRGVNLSTNENRPFVTSTSVAQGGAKTHNVNYQNVGCKIDLKTGIDAATDAVHMALQMELAVVKDSGVKLVEDQPATRKFGTVRQDCNGTVSAGRPLLLLSADASDPDRPAVAHVTRVQLKIPG